MLIETMLYAIAIAAALIVMRLGITGGLSLLRTRSRRKPHLSPDALRRLRHVEYWER